MLNQSSVTDSRTPPKSPPLIPVPPFSFHFSLRFENRFEHSFSTIAVSTDGRLVSVLRLPFKHLVRDRGVFRGVSLI